MEVQAHSISLRPLHGLPTVFARHLLSPDGNEDIFIDRVAGQLEAMGIDAPRLIGGREHEISTPEGLIKTRSLMVDGLERNDSLRLQEEGLGTWRMLGCGIFLPHKDIKAVYDPGENA